MPLGGATVVVEEYSSAEKTAAVTQTDRFLPVKLKCDADQYTSCQRFDKVLKHLFFREAIVVA